jgi:hypothetical protein
LKTVAFLILIFCQSLWAKKLSGEGEFLSIESDSTSFIKKQLIYSAKKNILNDYLSSLDLSPQQFWQGFDNKIDDRLKSKISWFNEKIKQMETSEKFDELLDYQIKKREMILKEKAKYLERSRVFSSYSIKNRSQSISNPSLKFIKLKVRINKSRLKNLFFSLTKEEINRVFKKLYVNVEFIDNSSLNDENLKKLYEDDLMEELKEALVKKWQNFLTKEYSDLVEEVVFTSNEETAELEKKILLSPQLVQLNQVDQLDSPNGLAVGENTSNEVEVESVETEVVKAENEDSSSLIKRPSQGELYLRISYSFKKSFYREESQKGEFEFKGGFVLFDLLGNSPVLYDDFKLTRGSLFSSTRNLFYSTLASKLYNNPLKSLRKNKKKLSRFPSVNNSLLVKVSKFKNMNDIVSLNEFLSISGATYNFNTSNIIVLSDTVYFDLHFNGTSEEVFNKFIQWENKKIGNNLVISSTVEDKKIEIIMKDESLELEGEGKDEIKEIRDI